MQALFLGTGTSDGVPLIGCSCKVCCSHNPKNKRLRASVLVCSGANAVLIDAGPDLRQQALRLDITRFDALFLTHAHADHIGGLPELRAFNWLWRGPVQVHGNEAALQAVRKYYDYFFMPQAGGGVPQLVLQHMDKPMRIGSLQIAPLPVRHGSLDILGYRVNDFVYITDASFVSGETAALCAGAQALVINALRYRPHETHFNVDQAVAFAQKVGARQSYLTHFCHDIEHETLNAALPRGIQCAYDGLRIEI